MLDTKWASEFRCLEMHEEESGHGSAISAATRGQLACECRGHGGQRGPVCL